MIKNTFSLLSGNWNIDDNYASVLYPFLLQIIKGTEISEKTKLPETTCSFFNETLLQSSASALTKAENSFDKSVAVVQMHHPIFKYDQTCGPKGSQSIMKILDSFKEDDTIAGVVLDFNSGGGQAAGNSEFAEYINEFKKTKPVVTYTNGLMCSAAYYMGAAASKIVINKHADYIGSIGTMFKSIDLDGTIEKAGGTIHEYYATISSLKNNAARKLKQGDAKPLINEILNPLAENFVADMKNYRPAIKEEAFKGDVYTTQNAIDLGLGDEIGNLKHAVNLVFKLATPTTNTNNKNKNMTTENLQQINAVLGVESLASTDEGVFLNQDQLEAINQELANNNQAVVDAQAETQTANDILSQAQAENNLVANALQTALTDAEVENAESLNAVEGVQALAALVAEYGAKDGAKPTTVNGGVTQTDVNPNIVGGIDISAAMNN